MEIPTQIRSEFGSGQSIDPKIARKAAECVARNAKSPSEALFFLDLLGLIDPLPENEVVILKKDRLTPQRKLARAEAKRKREEAELKRIQDLNIQPYEIGE